MKKFFLIILLSCLFSCKEKNKVDTLKDKAELVLKEKLHNPSSYEFVSLEADTLIKKANIESALIRINLIKEYIKDLEKDSIENKELLENHKIELLSAQYIYENLEKDKLDFILNFRATNAFGGLTLQKIKVISDTSFNFIELKELDNL